MSHPPLDTSRENGPPPQPRVPHAKNRLTPPTNRPCPPSTGSGSSGNRHHTGMGEHGPSTDVGAVACIAKCESKEYGPLPENTRGAPTIYDYIDYTKLAGASGERRNPLAHTIEETYKGTNCNHYAIDKSYGRRCHPCKGEITLACDPKT